MKGITRRWVTNILCVIVAVLCAVAVIFSLAINQYYYDGVRRELYSPADNASMYFTKSIGVSDSAFENSAREFVENFTYKDRMEVWVLTKAGKPYKSSTGFLPDENNIMHDYEKAIHSPDGKGEWIGKLPSGERVMAVTTVLYSASGARSGAVRYVASLENVDKQIFSFIAVICVTCLIIILFVILSNLYFISSIVNPVADITATAKMIAHGDFKARIDKHYDDEIGELCDTINDMAVELGNADQMKNDFISTISHELRTPLTAIKGWGETLKDMGANDPEMTEKGLDVISHEAGRLTGMVEELLDFSRMQSGRMTMRKEKMDVLAELDEAVFVFRERAHREGIEITYASSDLPAPAYADIGRIKQVFVNVLDNAFKYNHPGGKVSVKTELLDGKIKIEVADTGCGIKKEDLAHVKEKFYKANKSVRGSGIGLAVTDEIIKMHDGELVLDSVEGEGTIITIILPALVAPAEDPNLISEIAQAERSSTNEPKQS